MATPLEVRTALLTIALAMDPSPQDAPVNGWDYATQFASIDLSTLPVLIVSRVVGVVESWGMIAADKGLDQWEIEALLPIAEGPLEYPNAASAAAEAKQDEYKKAMADVLTANGSLSGTVARIGRGTYPDFRLFECMINHFQWNDAAEDRRVFWGYRFVVPVMQLHNQSMSK
jgi:hypothetical protein